MAITTKCPNCQTVLNLPPEAGGKRLKCPKCSQKFQAGTPESRAPSSAPGVAEARPASTVLLPPVRGHSDLDLPVSSGDLRDTFDLPMLAEDAPQGSARPSQTADAKALFQDDAPVRRRPTGAEARARPRRCSCGSVVPAGMSLCNHCGLNLETGQRVNMEEMLDDVAPPPPRSAGSPVGIILIGTLALLSSLLLAGLAFVTLEGIGRWALTAVCLFGVYASVLFLQGKSARPLLAALMLGGAINIMVLIGLPVYEGMTKIETPDAVLTTEAGDAVPILPYDQRVDTRRITWGIVILLIDGAAFVYLSTTGIRRHFDRPRPSGPLAL
ncbi:MAG: hypothetical protein ABI353_15515 [Isosphaeraceae bacterium]